MENNLTKQDKQCFGHILVSCCSKRKWSILEYSEYTLSILHKATCNKLPIARWSKPRVAPYWLWKMPTREFAPCWKCCQCANSHQTSKFWSWGTLVTAWEHISAGGLESQSVFPDKWDGTWFILASSTAKLSRLLVAQAKKNWDWCGIRRRGQP